MRLDLLKAPSSSPSLVYSILTVYIFIDQISLASSSNHKHISQQTHHHIQHVIRESYSEVSAYVTLHFNEKCKLALQNCLFRTEWEKVFGHVDTGQSSNQDLVYFYCQPFLIGRFCVDDYMRRSGADDWESALNLRCLNGTDGNSPVVLFKNSIYREKCKPFYGYYFDALSRANSLLNDVTTNRILISTFFVYFFFLFGHSDYYFYNF